MTADASLTESELPMNKRMTIIASMMKKMAPTYIMTLCFLAMSVKHPTRIAMAPTIPMISTTSTESMSANSTNTYASAATTPSKNMRIPSYFNDICTFLVVSRIPAMSVNTPATVRMICDVWVSTPSTSSLTSNITNAAAIKITAASIPIYLP